MSRKKLPAPGDPLAAKLFGRKNGRTIEDLTKRVNQLGCPASYATIKNWLAGSPISPVYRGLLAAALKRL